MTKKDIPILYLPWWDNKVNCIACHSTLKSIRSDCQKYCTHCCIIYAGCRYCLITNIIFGYTNHSRCKKCERTNYITSISGNDDLDEFLYDQRLKFYNNLQLDETVSKKFGGNQKEVL